MPQPRTGLKPKREIFWKLPETFHAHGKKRNAWPEKIIILWDPFPAPYPEDLLTKEPIIPPQNLRGDSFVHFVD